MNQDLTFMGNQFDEILEIIDNARARAMRAVNAELIAGQRKYKPSPV